MNLEISILTPYWSLKNIKTSEIILPTTTGKIGILKNHSSMLSTLDVGVISIKNNNNWEYIIIFGGAAIIENNNIRLVVIGAEKATDIDSTTIEASFLKAKTIAESAITKQEKIEADLKFKREKARLDGYNLVKR